MARNTVQQEHVPPEGGKMEMGGMAITGLDSIPQGVIPTEAPVLKGSVVRPPAPNAPKPKRHVVRKAITLTQSGYRTTIPEGKVIDEGNYDIEALRRIGAQLVPHTEDDD